MWERFSYYGMRAFLILYMVAPVTAGGLGFADAATPLDLRHLYRRCVWGRPSLGGCIADRLLGQYRSVLLGGVIIALGHFTLAFQALPFFYAGLALIVIGTGLLKPNVSTLVGSLYDAGRRASRRRLLDLLHGDQPRGVARAACRRIPGAARRLAPRLRVRPASGWRSDSVQYVARPQRLCSPRSDRIGRATDARLRRHVAPQVAGAFHADATGVAAHRRAIVIFFLVAISLLGRATSRRDRP